MNTINTLLLSFSISVFMIGCSGEGTDNAQLEADVSPVIPKIYSTVTEIRVNDNEQVKAGDTLVILDDATFRIAVEQAEIGLLQALRNVKVAGINTTSANVNVSNMTANSNAVSATMSSANAVIEAAKARLAVADKNYERYSQLLQQKSATQQQFDQVKADKADADARLQTAISQRDALVKQIDASKLQVENTRTEVSGTEEKIGLAELTVKEARTKLEAAKLQLSYCTIVAPVDGVVSRKNVQIGQVVTATGTPLMAIANNKKFWVMANFKETQTQKMRTGQKVDIEVDAYPDTTFTGKVESLSQATGARFSFLPADNATGNFVKVTQRIPVKITMADNESPNYQLRAGMSVYVKVKTN
jgi:membrane fusion protein (multidrug efflux system)